MKFHFVEEPIVGSWYRPDDRIKQLVTRVLIRPSSKLLISHELFFYSVSWNVFDRRSTNYWRKIRLRRSLTNRNIFPPWQRACDIGLGAPSACDRTILIILEAERVWDLARMENHRGSIMRGVSVTPHSLAPKWRATLQIQRGILPVRNFWSGPPGSLASTRAYLLSLSPSFCVQKKKKKTRKAHFVKKKKFKYLGTKGDARANKKWNEWGECKKLKKTFYPVYYFFIIYFLGGTERKSNLGLLVHRTSCATRQTWMIKNEQQTMRCRLTLDF